MESPGRVCKVLQTGKARQGKTATKTREDFGRSGMAGCSQAPSLSSHTPDLLLSLLNRPRRGSAPEESTEWSTSLATRERVESKGELPKGDGNAA